MALYLAVKSLLRLLCRIMSNHNNDHDCMKCLHLCRTENKLKLQNHDYLYIEITKKDKNTKNIIMENHVLFTKKMF